jgi:anti-sigma regulatory factor (Ser/Thr protein kinase)
MRDLSSNPNDHDEQRDGESHTSSDARAVGAHSFDRAYPAIATSVDRATRAVLGKALEENVGPACRARIGGAVSEVVDNALRRAYPCGGGWLRVRAGFDGREFVVVVQDFGVGFDSTSLDAELLSTPLHSGLARAMSLCEGLTIDSKPESGTRVELRFVPGHMAFGEGGTLDLSDDDYMSPEIARRVLHSLRRPETAQMHQLSPALAVAVGRLLAGPEPRVCAERALWS